MQVAVLNEGVRSGAFVATHDLNESVGDLLVG